VIWLPGPEGYLRGLEERAGGQEGGPGAESGKLVKRTGNLGYLDLSDILEDWEGEREAMREDLELRVVNW